MKKIVLIKNRILELVFTILPDKIYINLFFLYRFRYLPNLKKPASLNEKIQWLKLYDRTKLHTQLADKYSVREYVSNTIGAEYLIPLVFSTTRVKDINPSMIPDFPVIIKTNHTSSQYHIVYEKENVNWVSIQNNFNRWLKSDIYKTRKEWQYKHIEPRIVVEKLLLNNQGKIPEDFKIHCFHGEPKIIQVDYEKGTENYYRALYDTNWEMVNFTWNGKLSRKYNNEIVKQKKPENLIKMLKLSRLLSKDFVYARIDLYNLESNIFFGEITFHPGGGFQPIMPQQYDFKLGDLLDLSRLKNK